MVLKGFSKQDHVAISSLGLEFAVAELLGGALGIWLDKKWETSPWMLLLGVLGGFALGMYRIIRFAHEMDCQAKTAEKENGHY